MLYKNKQDHALELHHDPNLISPVFALKLSVDAEVEGIEVPGTGGDGNLFVRCYVKGNQGYILGNLLTKLGVSEPPPPVPSGEQLGWLIDDKTFLGMSRIEQREQITGHQIYTSDGRLLGGFPATERYYNTKRVTLYETGKELSDFGRLSYEEFAKEAPLDWAPSYVLQKWKSLMDSDTAFTDHTNGKAQNPITCVRNAVYIMGDKTRTIKGKTSKLWWYPVRVIKIGKYSSMRDQVERRPLLKINATISMRTYEGAGSNPFGQLGGRDVKVLTFGYDAIDYLPADRIDLLEPGQPIPSSYYPG